MEHASDGRTGRTANGERQQVGRLLEAYLDRLRAFVRLRAGPTVRMYESCSDLVQSVCRELLAQKSFQYRSEPQFRAWLFVTALNKIRKRYRTISARRRGDTLEARAESPECYSSLTPSREAIARERAELLERAFDRLPEHYREVIALARIAGLPGPVVAAQMGRSEGATRMLLSRALMRLSALMDAEARTPGREARPSEMAYLSSAATNTACRARRQARTASRGAGS